MAIPSAPAIRTHILSIIRPNKMTIRAPKMASLREPEPVKVNEVNPLKHLAKTVDAIPKEPKKTTPFAG
jgi:hypothetical protein